MADQLQLSETRRHVVIVFGDVVGFKTWARKSVESPATFRKFMEQLYTAFLQFQKATGCYLKLIGDGMMAVMELQEGHEGEVAEKAFTQAWHLKRVVRHAIIESHWPRPENFRVRLVAGNVWKVGVTFPNDQRESVDYLGYYVNLCHKLLDVRPDLVCMAHQSAKELLPETARREIGFGFERVTPNGGTTDGIDREDLDVLWSFGMDVKQIRSDREHDAEN